MTVAVPEDFLQIAKVPSGSNKSRARSMVCNISQNQRLPSNPCQCRLTLQALRDMFLPYQWQLSTSQSMCGSAIYSKDNPYLLYHNLVFKDTNFRFQYSGHSAESQLFTSQTFQKNLQIESGRGGNRNSHKGHLECQVKS